MTSATLIVVGAGHATGELVMAVRQEGYAGRIVVIGAESHLPYQRPSLSKGYDQLVMRGSTSAASFTAFYLREGIVIAADALQRPQEFMIARRLVAGRATIDPGRLTDESIPLKLLAEHWQASKATAADAGVIST